MPSSIKRFFKLTTIVMVSFFFCLTSCKKESEEENNNESSIDMPFKNQNGLISGAGGFSVAISSDGKTAVAGDPQLNNGLGGAHIYVRNGNNWILQNTLIGTGYSGQYNGYSPRNGTSVWQGTSVAISSDGNTVITGGDYDNYWGSAAFIFFRNGTTWTQQGPALDSFFSFDDDLDARSVTLSSDGNTAVVEGGLSGSYGGIYTSKAYVLSRNSGIWKLTQSITVDSASYDKLYNVGAVALSGDGKTLAICKRKPHGTFINIDYDGVIDIYLKSGNKWIKNINGQGLKPSSQNDIYGFGESISISQNGSAILVGTQSSGNKGGAYIYTSSIGGAWIQYGDIITKDIDPVKFNNLGSSVSMSSDGNSIVVNGNIIEKDSSPGLFGQNIIFLYNLKSNRWVREGDYLINNKAFEYGFGYSLSISADAKTILTGNKAGGINFFYP